MLVGIDFGLKRTGVAVTDSAMIIASPKEMIPTDQIMDWLKNFCASASVQGIVLGFPLKLNGEDAHITQNVLLFKEALEKELPGIQIHLQDERYSSSRAANAVHTMGKKKHTKNKGIIDKVSAAIILQDYLNERLNNR